LYAFGHGLSYTEFSYKKLQLDKKRLQKNDKLSISFDVKNTGKMTANEVVQVYVRPLHKDPLASIKNLRAFKSIALQPGENKTLNFELMANRDFTFYDEQQKAYKVKPGAYEIQVGASSSDIRLKKKIRIE
jgi:beta-glucosidase